MKLRIFITRVSLLSALLLSTAFACQTSFKKQTRYRMVPVYANKKVVVGSKKTDKIKKIEMDPVVIPKRGILGILPFTDDTNLKNPGLTASSELEHWFFNNRSNIDAMLRVKPGQCFGKHHCIQIIRLDTMPKPTQTGASSSPETIVEEEPIDETEPENLSKRAKRKWKKKLKKLKRKRESLKRRLKRKKLAREKNIKFPPADYYISGHVVEALPEKWVVILKAIDAQNHKVVWSARIRAKNATEFAEKAGAKFLPHTNNVVIGHTTVPTYAVKRVMVRKVRKKEIVNVAVNNTSEPKPFVSAGISAIYRPHFLMGVANIGGGLQWDKGNESHRLHLHLMGGMGTGSGAAGFLGYDYMVTMDKLSFIFGVAAGGGKFSYKMDNCQPLSGAVEPQCYRYFIPVGLVSAGVNYNLGEWSFGPGIQVLLGYGEDYNNSESEDTYFYSLNFLLNAEYRF